MTSFLFAWYKVTNDVNLSTSEVTAASGTSISVGDYDFVFTVAAPTEVALTNSSGQTYVINGAGEKVPVADMGGESNALYGTATATLTGVYLSTDTGHETNLVSVANTMKLLQGSYKVTFAGTTNVRIHPAATSTTKLDNASNDVFDDSETVYGYFKITSAGAIAYYGQDSTLATPADMAIKYSIANTSESAEEAHADDKVSINACVLATA